MSTVSATKDEAPSLSVTISENVKVVGAAGAVNVGFCALVSSNVIPCEFVHAYVAMDPSGSSDNSPLSW